MHPMMPLIFPLLLLFPLLFMPACKAPTPPLDASASDNPPPPLDTSASDNPPAALPVDATAANVPTDATPAA